MLIYQKEKGLFQINGFLKLKETDGNVAEDTKQKARLVLKGCLQRKGLDNQEVYAPVARLTTVSITQANLCKKCVFALKSGFFRQFRSHRQTEKIAV